MIDLKIKRINEIDKEKLKKLFLRYPFKDFQRATQGLDNGLLGDFFVKGIENKIRNSDIFCFGVEDSGDLAAIFNVEPLKKHSEIYDKKMFRISTYLNYLKPEDCFNLFWEKLEKLVYNKNIIHLSCRLDASDYRNISVLTTKEFRYRGVSMKLSLFLKQI